MTPKEILERHPKGKEFGHLLHGKSLYPIFVDAAGEVLSMPPIINSNYSGNVTEKTNDVFIECSGFDLKFLNTALNVIVAALHERGGIINNVKVNYGKKSYATPDLTPKKFYTTINYIRKTIGLELPEKRLIELAEKALYSIKITGRKIEMLYPAYRQDIMHERDIAEDIAISYGFNSMEISDLKLITKGGIFSSQVYSDRIAELMTGCGFQEILSYTLTNISNLFEKMNTPGAAVEIEKPQSANWSVFRTSLVPCLLEFLTKNMHIEYPQSIFEIGNVIVEDASAPTRTKDITKIAAAVSAAVVNYDRISSVLDALLRNIGVEYKLRRSSHPSFIEGRTAEIFVGKDSIGFIGEIHPLVLNKWDLENPVVTFELDLMKIFELLEKR